VGAGGRREGQLDVGLLVPAEQRANADLQVVPAEAAVNALAGAAGRADVGRREAVAAKVAGGRGQVDLVLIDDRGGGGAARGGEGPADAAGRAVEAVQVGVDDVVDRPVVGGEEA